MILQLDDKYRIVSDEHNFTLQRKANPKKNPRKRKKALEASDQWRNVVMVGAGDVPGPAGARARLVERILHGLNHDGVLTHAEVVVAAPHDHVAGPALAAQHGVRELIGAARQIREHAIAALFFKGLDLAREEFFVEHGANYYDRPRTRL